MGRLANNISNSASAIAAAIIIVLKERIMQLSVIDIDVIDIVIDRWLLLLLLMVSSVCVFPPLLQVIAIHPLITLVYYKYLAMPIVVDAFIWLPHCILKVLGVGAT